MAKDRSTQHARPMAGIEANRLQSALLVRGVSFLGAHQFVHGLPVSSPHDRAALRGLLSEILRVTFTFQPIATRWSDGKGWSDDWRS